MFRCDHQSFNENRFSIEKKETKIFKQLNKCKISIKFQGIVKKLIE